MSILTEEQKILKLTSSNKKENIEKSKQSNNQMLLKTILKTSKKAIDTQITNNLDKNKEMFNDILTNKNISKKKYEQNNKYINDNETKQNEKGILKNENFYKKSSLTPKNFLKIPKLCKNLNFNKMNQNFNNCKKKVIESERRINKRNESINNKKNNNKEFEKTDISFNNTMEIASEEKNIYTNYENKNNHNVILLVKTYFINGKIKMKI